MCFVMRCKMPWQARSMLWRKGSGTAGNYMNGVAALPYCCCFKSAAGDGRYLLIRPCRRRTTISEHSLTHPPTHTHSLIHPITQPLSLFRTHTDIHTFVPGEGPRGTKRQRYQSKTGRPTKTRGKQYHNPSINACPSCNNCAAL